jgi:lysyl-tRNA synthetase class 2
LMFLDIDRDTQRLQIMVDLKKLAAEVGVEDSYKSFKKVARVGDWICRYRASSTMSCR